jgi:hypothetical protein
MAIATLADLKTHMGITASDQDAKLTVILSGVERWLKDAAKAAGIALEKETVTEDLDGEGAGRLFLRYRPVISVTTVYESDSQVFDATTEVAAADFRLYKEIGMLKRENGAWLDEAQGVRVIYEAGYATPPETAKLGILVFAAYLAGQAGKEGFSQERLGEYAYALRALEEVPAAKELLAPYINRLVIL